MTYVVQQRAKSSRRAISITRLWQGSVRSTRVVLAIARVSLKCREYLLRCFDDAERVLQAVVPSAGVHKMSHSQLANSSQALKERAVHEQHFAGKELDGAPDRAVHRLRKPRHSVGQIQTAQHRRSPSVD